MDVMGPLHRFDDYQQKRNWLAVPVAVVAAVAAPARGVIVALPIAPPAHTLSCATFRREPGASP